MAFRWIGKAKDGNSVTLHKLASAKANIPPYATEAWIQQNLDIIRRGLILDVETTGLSHADDVIIELAIRQFLFNKNTGEVLKLEKSYSSFQDPQRPLREEIIQLTGITDEMLVNQSIDWKAVEEIFESSQIIIAHNARFDRPFIEKNLKKSVDKIWGCSLKQIDWAAKGFFSSKLELLNIYHGFFVDAHRAINDVDALLYLLSLSSDERTNTYLSEIISNARRPTVQIIASSSPFETKDLLKIRGYNWDNLNKFWHRTIYKDDFASEISWLEENVYTGAFGGFSRDIPLTDTFRN